MRSLFEGMENFDETPLVKESDLEGPLETLNEDSEIMRVESHKLEDEIEKSIQASEDITFIEEFTVELENHPHNSEFILRQLEKKLVQTAERYKIPRAREISYSFSKENFESLEQLDRKMVLQEAHELVRTMRGALSHSNEGFWDYLKDVGKHIAFKTREVFGKVTSLESMLHLLKDDVTYTVENKTSNKINVFNNSSKGITTQDIVNTIDGTKGTLGVLGEIFEYIKNEFGNTELPKAAKDITAISKKFSKFKMIDNFTTVRLKKDATGYDVDRVGDQKGAEIATFTKKEIEQLFNYLTGGLKEVDRVGVIMNSGIDKLMMVKPDDLSPDQKRLSILFNNSYNLFKLLLDMLYFMARIMFVITNLARKQVRSWA